MNTFPRRRIRPILAAALALGALPLPVPTTAAADAFAPAYTGELSPRWRERLDALAAPAAIEADFTELRHTPLKKKPVELRGVVRLAHGHGLSLAYEEDRAPVVILDEKGLLLRHPDGREQNAPPEAEADLRLLHALFSFDLLTLEKTYALDAAEGADGAWILTFTRRPDAEASYRDLILRGTADQLTGLVLAKTPNLKTEIQLAPPRRLDAFPQETLTRDFR